MSRPVLFWARCQRWCHPIPERYLWSIVPQILFIIGTMQLGTCTYFMQKWAKRLSVCFLLISGKWWGELALMFFFVLILVLGVSLGERVNFLMPNNHKWLVPFCIVLKVGMFFLFRKLLWSVCINDLMYLCHTKLFSFWKATSIPNFSYMGARLCNYLSHHLTISPQSGNFRQLLLQRSVWMYESEGELLLNMLEFDHSSC